jgi:formamidopyrimidine-DNA glycosylase
MPELPEVETVTNALRPHLIGRRIERVDTYTERLRGVLDLEDRDELVDAEIVDVRRRSKYIIAELNNGSCLLMHLGMTGSFRTVPAGTERLKHEHVIFLLDNDVSWRYTDPRRFGIMEVHPLPEAGGVPEALGGLGPEPLSDDFPPLHLHDVSRGKKQPIKSFLMDNHNVVGVGNIYASESLFRSRIHPRTPAGRLSKERHRRLHAAICEVLGDAIKAGGSTIADFKGVDGSEGKFAQHLDVYARDGQPCSRCPDETVRKIVMSGRSTFYCPKCQRW